jgi:hypothetical protein
MTVRVATFDALVGSSNRLVPNTLRTLSAVILDRFTSWWQNRTALVMSDDWMSDFRCSRRDSDSY